MYPTIIQVQLSPDELTDLIRGVFRSELATYTPPPPAVELPDYLTRKQTAKVLQISLQTLNTWAKDTEERPALLVPQKVGFSVRYRRDDVLAALKENRRFKKPDASDLPTPAKRPGRSRKTPAAQ